MVIAGPTASGKSALAVALAERVGGVVVNADAIQLYDTLEIVSARPGPEARGRAPHRLYGVLAGEDRCSAGRWRAMAEAEIARAQGAGRLPILVGGTGLYLKTLTEGIAPVPPIDPALRAGLRRALAAEGARALHARLRDSDPKGAGTIAPSDSQRTLRALEVVEQTGRPLHAWQAAGNAAKDARHRFLQLLLMPDRDRIYAACERRFKEMLAAGAVAEAGRAGRLGLAPDLPVMKAVGLAPLIALTEGRLGRGEAVLRAMRDTRRYARRQMTWFRHQMTADRVIAETYSETYSERIKEEILSLVSSNRLTTSG